MEPQPAPRVDLKADPSCAQAHRVVVPQRVVFGTASQAGVLLARARGWSATASETQLFRERAALGGAAGRR